MTNKLDPKSFTAYKQARIERSKVSLDIDDDTAKWLRESLIDPSGLRYTAEKVGNQWVLDFSRKGGPGRKKSPARAAIEALEPGATVWLECNEAVARAAMRNVSRDTGTQFKLLRDGAKIGVARAGEDGSMPAGENASKYGFEDLQVGEQITIALTPDTPITLIRAAAQYQRQRYSKRFSVFRNHANAVITRVE